MFINDLQWLQWSSVIFNDHSILLHWDYYWLIMDYNHDSRLKHFPTWKFLDFELFQLENFLVQFSLRINDLQWSFNTLLLYRDYYWLIMDCNHDYRLKPLPTWKFSDLEIIFPLRNCLRYFFDFYVHQWSSMTFNGLHWSSMIIQYYFTGINTD